jgi:hypothetical protein
VLQKSKVEELRIFHENTSREAIADSYILYPVTEFAYEFDAKPCDPSHLYTKAAPVARRIFEHQCKTTFATQSAQSVDFARPRRLRRAFPAALRSLPVRVTVRRQIN